MGRNISEDFRKADRLVGELCTAHNRDMVRKRNPREKSWAESKKVLNFKVPGCEGREMGMGLMGRIGLMGETILVVGIFSDV